MRLQLAVLAAAAASLVAVGRVRPASKPAPGPDQCREGRPPLRTAHGVSYTRISTPVLSAKVMDGSTEFDPPASGSVTVIAISDEHMPFNPYATLADYPMGGGPADPANMVNQIRALLTSGQADYLLVSGDLGNTSIAEEFSGWFVQSLTAVTSVNTPVTVTINGSSSYSEFGTTVNPDNYATGTTSSPFLMTSGTGQWGCLYDDSTGANFEMVKVNAVTQHTVTITAQKTHPAGFLMRAHSMCEYWDFVLQHRVKLALGNHDQNCITGPINCATMNQGPANILNFFGSMFPAAPKTYWAAALDAGNLVGAVAVDVMANAYPGGDGSAVGSVQELALRPALTNGIGTQWLVEIQHFPAMGTCLMPANPVGNPWGLGAAVDITVGGHIHMLQGMMGPQWISPSGKSNHLIPGVDISAYTGNAWDPLDECEGVVSAHPVGQYCPGCTRYVLNSYNGGSVAGGDHFRAFLQMTFTQTTMTAKAVTNTGATAVDYSTRVPLAINCTKPAGGGQSTCIMGASASVPNRTIGGRGGVSGGVIIH